MALTTAVAVGTSSLSPLLSGAMLCLLAGRVSDYHTGEPWRNLGTAGQALDARVVSQPDFVPANDPDGPGFKREIPGTPKFGTAANRMFDIPGVLLAPTETDAWTCTICTTPLYAHPQSVRYLWKYAGDSLPVSSAGLVIENVATFPYQGGVGHGLIAAIHNPTPVRPPTITPFFLGGANPPVDIQRTRQVLAFRYDPVPVPPATDGEVTVWRNGTTFADPASITEPGPWIDTTHIRIGSGQICHAVLWHDRALTDTEMAELSDLLLR